MEFGIDDGIFDEATAGDVSGRSATHRHNDLDHMVIESDAAAIKR